MKSLRLFNTANKFKEVNQNHPLFQYFMKHLFDEQYVRLRNVV